MEKFVRISKNVPRALASLELLEDAYNQALFVSAIDFFKATGEVPLDEKTYFLTVSPDSEIFMNHPHFDSEAYETEQGYMIPLAWEQFIPMSLIGRDDY